MKITEVKIFPRNSDSLRGIAHIVFDEVFVVKSIKIIEGKNGPFIAMPSAKTKKGEHRDICHPLNTETRNEIEKLIIEKYHESLKEAPKTETEEE